MLPAVAFLFMSSVPAMAQKGDLKIHFEYGGAAPNPSAIDVNKDVQFCGQGKLMNERLLVNPKNKGLKNVVVYVYTGRGGSKLDDVPPAKKILTLANDKCRFEPHIVIAQTGDTLKVTNPDTVGHTANLGFSITNSRTSRFLLVRKRRLHSRKVSRLLSLLIATFILG